MKVTVVGAGGNVGSTVVDVLAQRDICKEIVAVDIEKKDGDKTFYPSKGRGLDQWESAPVHLFDTRIKGTVDYADTAGSDVCVITAGVPRRPGMSRDDLLEMDITKKIALSISFIMSYDAEPIIDIPNLTYALSNGLVIKL